MLQLIQVAQAAERPSASQFADKAGVSRSAITHALAGTRVPPRPTLLQLAAAYGADPQEWARLWDAYYAERWTARAERAASQRAARPPKRCPIDGCPNKPAPTFCSTHHRHKQLYGNPTAGEFRPKVHGSTCSLEDCDRPYYSRDLCRRHYSSWWKAGQPVGDEPHRQ